MRPSFEAHLRVLPVRLTD